MSERGYTERQQAIAEVVGQVIAVNGVDFGENDVVAVHSETIGFRIIDALREAGLTITRKYRA
jgi:hypothetical protein